MSNKRSVALLIGKYLPFLKKMFKENTKQRITERIFYLQRGIFRKHFLKKYLSSTTYPKLQIGCGIACQLKGWLNADIIAGDIYLNVTKRFPFDDNTFELIFSDMLVEHLELIDVKYFLSEVYRTLKKGGVFRVGTIDLQKLINCYNETNNKLFSDLSLSMVNKEKAHHCELFNSLWDRSLRGHKFIFDFDFLKKTLEEVGFKNVIKCKRLESSHKELCNIENAGEYNLEYIVLVLECEK